MAKEIERKFLVKNDDFKKLAQGVTYRQGYLNSAKERTVRVRSVGSRGFIAVKGISVGVTRVEYEYEIPFDDCKAMLDNLVEKPVIEKKRYKIRAGKFTWEVDEFLGENQGLIVAEIELENEDDEFERPDWLGEEVSGDPRYFNSSLISHPFNKW